MKILALTAAGFLLDLMLGDPEWFPHPVVMMGRVIVRLEKVLRGSFSDTPEGRRRAGMILAAVLPAGTFFIALLIIKIAGFIHPSLGYTAAGIWCWQALAMCCLKKESENVRRKLVSGTLAEARKAVGRIVGRDTGELSDAGVTRAAVETVAENFSDGEIAPLFYMLIGGAPLALAYKAVNTMDSVNGAHRALPAPREAGGHADGVLLGDADVKQAARAGFVKAGEARALAHRGDIARDCRGPVWRGYVWRLANLAARSKAPRKPQLGPDGGRDGGSASCAACGAGVLFRREGREALYRGSGPAD